MDSQELIFYALIGVLAKVVTWDEKWWHSSIATAIAVLLVRIGTYVL